MSLCLLKSLEKVNQPNKKINRFHLDSCKGRRKYIPVGLALNILFKDTFAEAKTESIQIPAFAGMANCN